jgi:uncharacterized protein
MALPLPLRNRLADLILDAVHDVAAREGLAAVAAVCLDPRAGVAAALPSRFPADLFERGPRGLAMRSGYAAHAGEFCARARAGWDVLRARPLDPTDAPLGSVLAVAAALFDAGLFFEVHELLEPHWFRAQGTERDRIQGLIQVAVGFQHLANGNLRGAVLLLHEGGARLPGEPLAGLELDAFAAAAQRCGAAAASLDPADAGAAARFDWTMVPPFPSAAAGA